LLDVLRNHLGLTGTRFGCGLEAMRDVHGTESTAKPREILRKGAVDPRGQSVTTIEGLGHRPIRTVAAGLHRDAGRQCGLLSLGHIDLGEALLDRDTAPTRPRSRRRSMTTSVVAARITGSCARSRSPPPYA